jgi:hypothetical protein
MVVQCCGAHLLCDAVPFRACSAYFDAMNRRGKGNGGCVAYRIIKESEAEHEVGEIGEAPGDFWDEGPSLPGTTTNTHCSCVHTCHM